MKVSYNLLNTYFSGTLPEPQAIADALMFHVWEIEDIIPAQGDTVLDVKILPDKSPWALSHRGIAKDLSVILGESMVAKFRDTDQFQKTPILEPLSPALKITLQSSVCDRYTAAHISGITVGPSPKWLADTLSALGQRSINNVVDLTNYVLFLIGQPLHAFDAKKIPGLHIAVRSAREGEELVTLTGETRVLTSEDTLIVDGDSDVPLGIAGVKGGKYAEIDTSTTEIVLESAHFDAKAIRKTSHRLSLRTDASTRFENGIVSDLALYGVTVFVELLMRHASDFGSPVLVGYADAGEHTHDITPVSVSLEKINSVLGVTLSQTEVQSIFDRFAYETSWNGTVLTVIPPFERTDLCIAEDLIEEVGRIYGYEHVPTIEPEPQGVPEINTVFYFTNRMRTLLAAAGFSEIYTSSFRATDMVKLKNAFASDKGYLRSSLRENMREALSRNMGNADLLGVTEVRMFEIGTSFTRDNEELSIALGVRSKGGYRPKHDDPIIQAGIAVVHESLGRTLTWQINDGIAEAPLSSVMEELRSATPSQYDACEKKFATYEQFSLYPFITRDIALFVPDNVTPTTIEAIIRAEAGELCTRVNLFDTFSKDGRTSYAFRMLFQSMDRTLTDDEVEVRMAAIYSAVKTAGFEVR